MQAQDYVKKRMERMGMDVDRPIVHAHVQKTEPGITLRADRDATKARAREHFAAIKAVPVATHAFARKQGGKTSPFKKSFDKATFLKNK